MSDQYRGGHVLLYHGVFLDIPSGLESRIHNVSPENFRQQITWLRQNFDIVTLEEFSISGSRKGLAAITFDDAYSSVFSNALPWLIDQKIPATVFVNSSLVEGGLFWRDKVRYIIGNQLTDDFLSYSCKAPWISRVRRERFYKDTKNPYLNSKIVSDAIDTFFQDRGLVGIVEKHLENIIARREDFLSHPLITYGNHSHSHFVLSSLTKEQQLAEITCCQSWLVQSRLEVCNLFAAPFGGSADVNEITNEILLDQGSSGLVMSRKAVNSSVNSMRSGGINTIERYMAPATLSELKDMASTLDQR